MCGLETAQHRCHCLHVIKNKHDQQKTLASLDMISNLVSTMLEYDIPLDVILFDMDTSSRNKNDLPGILSKILGFYV